MPFTFAGNSKTIIWAQRGGASETMMHRYKPILNGAKDDLVGGALRTAGTPPHACVDEPTELEMRSALNACQFLPYYQPIVHANNRQVFGYEALARWRTAERGIIAAATFIPAAERSGFITELSAFVLAEACRELAIRSKTRGIFVNISAVSFENADVLAIVSAALESSGLEPHRLTIEVTESVYLHLTDFVSFQIEALVKVGVQIAIDDFGTGYSSLSCLNAIPFNCIKIDKSFVRKLATDAKSRVVVQAILDIAGGLGMQTIAEGIETEDEARIMTDMGVTALQGYLFGHPLAAEVAFEDS